MMVSASWKRVCVIFTVIILTTAACGFPARLTGEPRDPAASPVQPAGQPSPPHLPPTPVVGQPTPSELPSIAPSNPREVVSTSRLLAYLEGLTSIQPNSGWRNSASQGEREALDYAALELGKLDFLVGSGLTMERQEFRVNLAMEIWEAQLTLGVDGVEFEIPTNAIRGSRDSLNLALGFDSDGSPNDSRRSPVERTGEVILVRTQAELDALANTPLAGTLVLANYALFDRIVRGDDVFPDASRLVEQKPEGIILVTQFSNHPGESHGTFIGEGGVFAQVPNPGRIPILFSRLEDMASAGILAWADLVRVQNASLRWDADVFSPGTSGNLHAFIPGADGSRALILSAHIDSANTPGAMDDGSGSAVLLETAAALNQAHALPPVDLHLVWFGSEELGLFGSGHFANTHQDLLDKTVAMLEFDCMTRPLDGLSPTLTLITWPPTAVGDQNDPWSLRLQAAAENEGIELTPLNLYSIASDNSSFAGFDVPNADVIYQQEPEMESLGGVWFAGHIHDPYDTLDLIREVSAPFTDMVQVALGAIFDTRIQQDSFRVTPKPGHRILFIASHAEPVHMTPAALMGFGMELSNQGFDIDVIPYGQAVTQADLQDVDLAIALPVVDYADDLGSYDESWTAQEIEALKAYVDQGGFLVIANSAHRMKYVNLTYEANEDWQEANALAGEFGVEYTSGALQTNFRIEPGSPLMEGVTLLDSPEFNAVPFTITEGEVLVHSGADPAVALVSSGSASGEVLILSDLGFLGNGFRGPVNTGPVNTRFWQNLAAYAKSR
jgi:hypothetical protein